MIRIGLAEEHRIPRWALHEALAKSVDFEIVGEAGSVDETIDLVKTAKPDVLVLDTALPDHSAFDVLSRLSRVETGSLIVVLSPNDDPAFAAHAMAAGAHAYVYSSDDPAKLLEAIRAVSRGERVVPAEVDKALAARDRHPASTLTARELQIMEMLARGLTSREIAHDLDISTKTVDTHRAHLLQKLRLRNNAELARFAVKHGFVSP